jgi:hypothetical protein
MKGANATTEQLTSDALPAGQFWKSAGFATILPSPHAGSQILPMNSGSAESVPVLPIAGFRLLVEWLPLITALVL